MLSAILYRLKYCLIPEKLHRSIRRLGEEPRTLCQLQWNPLKTLRFNIQGPEAAVVWKAVKWDNMVCSIILVPIPPNLGSN